MATLQRGAGYEYVWRGDDMTHSVKNNSQSGMQRLGEIAQSVMNSRVPVQTGYLKSTIFSRVTISDGVLVLEFGASAYYTLFVELGTSTMPAKPFIRPAADAVKTYAKAAFTQSRGAGGRFQ